MWYVGWMPPLVAYWRAFCGSSADSLRRRKMGLNDSARSSGCMFGRLPPKKLVSCTLRGGSCREADSGLGLEWLLGCPPGWNVFAVGLNSIARTLNFGVALDVGVGTPLEDAEGPVGGSARISWAGMG